MDRDGIKKYLIHVATKKGWVINPDVDFTSSITDGLEKNYSKTGSLFCPCREIPDRNTAYHKQLCPCTVAQQDIVKYGQCFCGLFLDKEKNPQDVQSIEDSLIN